MPSCRQQNTQLVAEAMQNLQKAVDINPSYDDAMQYLNLSYRRKADLECTDDNARKADLAPRQMSGCSAPPVPARPTKPTKEKKLGGGVQM